jgi:hypothetical protein
MLDHPSPLLHDWMLAAEGAQDLATMATRVLRTLPCFVLEATSP